MHSENESKHRVWFYKLHDLKDNLFDNEFVSYYDIEPY